ncbi:MAG: TolC family protein, partial [Nitrospiraceae bacterium]
MKETLFLILLLACLVVLIPCRSEAAEYTLEDLHRLSLERSETIRIAEEDVRISELDKDRAMSVLIPTLSAFGYHTRYSKEIQQGEVILQPDYTNEWGLRLNQTFSLSGKEFTALSIAKEGIKQSRFDLSATQEEYLFTVATQYYVLLRAKKEVDIAHANIERLTKQRDAARKRLEVGEVTRTVLLRAEAELASAQSDLIRAKNTVRLASTRLAKTVGISGDYDIREPLTKNEYPMTDQGEVDLSSLAGDCTLPPLDCFKETAFSERAEIRSLAIRRDIAGEEVTVARGAYWPDLSLEGVYRRQENSPSTSFGLDERTYGALMLDFPFFEGGLRKAEVGQAKARLRQAELGLEDLKNTVSVQVENAYLLVIREAAVFNQLKVQLEYASDNYNLVSKQF